MFRVVIPARYGSTRLPGKPLVLLRGRPMIQWVYEHACQSRASEVLIATDDDRIHDAARAFGAPVMMTAVTHATGSDRIAEVARTRGWDADSVVVNLQGDEPLMPPALIDQVAALLEEFPAADIATLAARMSSIGAFMDPNVVKVVSDLSQRALYFSRAPIPWNRDGAAAGLASQRSFNNARRHIGMYAYRVRSLFRLAALPPSTLEHLEKLEQLRALDHGLDVRVADADTLPGPDVNTAEDIGRVEAMLSPRA